MLHQGAKSCEPQLGKSVNFIRLTFNLGQNCGKRYE